MTLTRQGALVCALLSVMSAPARADRAVPLNTLEASCQAEIGRRAFKLFDARLRGEAKCARRIAKGQACKATDTDFSKAEAKFVAAFDQRCDVAGVSLESIGFPEDLSFAQSFATSDMATRSRRIENITWTNAAAAVGDASAQKCLLTLGKEARKLAKLIGKLDRACLDKIDGGGVCDEQKRSDKIGAATDKSVLKVGSKCSPAQISTLTLQPDTPTWVDAVAESVRGAVCDLYPRAGNEDICPSGPVTAIEITQLVGDLKLGWQASGDATGAGLPTTVDLLNCSGGSPNTCEFTSPIDGDVIAVTPTVQFGVNVCLVSTGLGDSSGTITFDGAVETIDAFDVSLPQRVSIHLAPCPICSGAEVGDSGTCQSGPQLGDPCEVEAVSTHGNTSTTCLPDPITNVGQIDVDPAIATTGNSTLDSTFACEAPLQVLNCHCENQKRPNACASFACNPDGTCADDPAQACFPETIDKNGAISAGLVSTVTSGCAPAANNPAINNGTGLPGPFGGTFKLRVRKAP